MVFRVDWSGSAETSAGTANLFATKALAAGAPSRKSIFGGLARQKLVEAVPAKSAALERKSRRLFEHVNLIIAKFYLDLI